MTTLQDTDLLLINRAGVDYKCTYKDWKGAQVVNLIVAVVTAISGNAEVGSTLSVTPGIAAGGTAPITHATRWQISDDGTSGWTDIPGATGATYTVLATQLNKFIRALTVATDSTPTSAKTLDIPSASTAKIVSPAVAKFGWDADSDAYTRDAVGARNIDVHSRVRRCLVTDAGGVTYLDADNSKKLAGDWLRLCETTELSTPYTGVHGAEIANSALRGSAPTWAAGTYTKGQRVTHSGFVWECLVATTNAAPAAGSAVAQLDGRAGQVMVEIPRFSVWHETAPSGSYLRHNFHVRRGTKVDGGYAVHPAFVRPNGSYHDFIYISAYLATGVNGNGCISGVQYANSFKRVDARVTCRSRGASWQMLSYWDYSALQWLVLTEYQDMNTQRVLGNGAASLSSTLPTSKYTGHSDARGNRCSHIGDGSDSSHSCYRGIENIHSHGFHIVDGLNIHGFVPYVCNDPSKWADATDVGYTALPTLHAHPSSAFTRDIGPGIALLPSAHTGASSTTFVGDACPLNAPTGWFTPYCGGTLGWPAGWGGMFHGSFDNPSGSDGGDNKGTRLCHKP
jgi:hypothetical protein